MLVESQATVSMPVIVVTSRVYQVFQHFSFSAHPHMILIDGRTPASVDLDFIIRTPQVSRMAKEFEELPSRVIDRGTKSWCVLQSESCSVPWGEGVVGSADATTCVILFLLHSLGVTVLHADEGSSENSSYMQRCIQDIGDESADLYLVGGYADETGKSAVVVNNVLRYLHSCPLKLEIRQAYVGVFNTVQAEDGSTPLPRHQAACVDLQSRTLLPANFAYRGPAFSTRQCRLMAQSSTASDSFGDLRDAATGSFRVSRWDFELSPRQIAYFQRLLELDDRKLLNFTSTSPMAEGPRFASDMRDTLQTLVKFPNGARLFPNGDLVFCWNGVEWVDGAEEGQRKTLREHMTAAHT